MLNQQCREQRSETVWKEENKEGRCRSLLHLGSSLISWDKGNKEMEGAEKKGVVHASVREHRGQSPAVEGGTDECL